MFRKVFWKPQFPSMASLALITQTKAKQNYNSIMLVLWFYKVWSPRNWIDFNQFKENFNTNVLHRLTKYFVQTVCSLGNSFTGAEAMKLHIRIIAQIFNKSINIGWLDDGPKREFRKLYNNYAHSIIVCISVATYLSNRFVRTQEIRNC